VISADEMEQALLDAFLPTCTIQPVEQTVTMLGGSCMWDADGLGRSKKQALERVRNTKTWCYYELACLRLDPLRLRLMNKGGTLSGVEQTLMQKIEKVKERQMSDAKQSPHGRLSLSLVSANNTQLTGVNEQVNAARKRRS